MPLIPRKSERRPWMAKQEAFANAPGKTNKFYHSAAWRKFRQFYLKKHPLCVKCEQKGMLTPATTVDHIRSINPVNGWDVEGGKWPNPLDSSNCQPLCFYCHASKTAQTRKHE